MSDSLASLIFLLMAVISLEVSFSLDQWKVGTVWQPMHR